MLSCLKRQKLDRSGILSCISNATVRALFAIALHVVKAKKAYMIGKTFLKPCILETVKLIFRVKQTIKHILLSNDTTKSRLC